MDDIDREFRLQPLKPVMPAMVPIKQLLAVGEVRLAAGDVPGAVLKDFYGKMLGLTFVSADEDSLQFRHHQQRIILERGRPELGRAGLLIREFGGAMLRLRQRGVVHEVLHTDSGMTRTAVLRDPAGNWIHLLETRAF